MTTVSQVADTLRTSRQTVYRLIDSGELKASPGRRGITTEVEEDSLQDYISRLRTGAGKDDTIPQLWTIAEVAERLGISKRMLEEDCRAGRVAHVHRGRRRLMTTDQIRILVEKHTRLPQPDSAAVDKATEQKIAQERLNRMLKGEARRRSRRV